MNWNLIILITGIIAALYALPYGRWEWLENNKAGGILVYIAAGICVILSSLQMWI